MPNDLAETKAPQEYLPEEQMKAVSIDLEEAKQSASQLEIKDDAAMEEANAVCGKIRARQKGIETFRLAIVKPLKDHIAKIDKFFKDLGGQFDPYRETIEGKVQAYRLKKIAAARKEDEKIAAAAAKGKVLVPKKEAPAQSSYQEGVGRTTFVKDAEYKITDESLIPDEFWIVDEKKLGSRVREIKKDLEVGKVYTDKIAGVTITCTERPSYAGEK